MHPNLTLTPFKQANQNFSEGNVFVMVAILIDRHLQSVANYLILSLGKTTMHHSNLSLITTKISALADLLVAVLVMPFSAVYEVIDLLHFLFS